jgi:hypothetical protein
MVEVIESVLQWLFKLIGLRQSVRVLCHRGVFLPSGPDCYFINVTNLSLQRDAVVTHVWMDCGGKIQILNLSRPLPHRLKPEESWETWIEVKSLPSSFRDNAFECARVHLSNGRVIKSKENKTVPSAGYVPGV